MGFFDTVIALVAMGCGTGTFVWLTICVKDIILNRSRRAMPEVLAEIRAVREEIARLRAENHDLVLSFDSTLQNVDRRLATLEGQRPLSHGSTGREQEVPAHLAGRR